MKLNNPTKPIAELFIARALNSLGAKLVFSPMQTMGTSGKKYKLALTLHDLIYYRHKTPPSEFNWLIKLGWRLFHLSYAPQRKILNRADLVVTVSNTTKKLMQQHRLTVQPITVVYNAGPGSPLPVGRAQLPEHKTLVYMGSFMKYKNVETLVQAMALLPDFKLHLLSRISDSRKRELRALAAPDARIEFKNGVSDEAYVAELDQAFALVSASLDEGFGIPLIESMMRATPIVVSKLEIFEEVGATAAKYFEPTSPEDFAAAVRKIDSLSSWALASQAALNRANVFSWKKSAAALVAALEKI